MNLGLPGWISPTCGSKDNRHFLDTRPLSTFMDATETVTDTEYHPTLITCKVMRQLDPLPRPYTSEEIHSVN